MSPLVHMHIPIFLNIVTATWWMENRKLAASHLYFRVWFSWVLLLLIFPADLQWLNAFVHVWLMWDHFQTNKKSTDENKEQICLLAFFLWGKLLWCVYTDQASHSSNTFRNTLIKCTIFCSLAIYVWVCVFERLIQILDCLAYNISNNFSVFRYEKWILLKFFCEMKRNMLKLQTPGIYRKKHVNLEEIYALIKRS